MDNKNLKLIISYLNKTSEITFDINSSFKEIKSKIIKEFNISEKDSIYIKFFDIKYEKIDSQNFQLKLELNNENASKNTISKLEMIIKEKDRIIDLSLKEINSLKEQIEKINDDYKKNINDIEDTYESLKQNLILQNIENFKSINNELIDIERKINFEKNNKDNNIINDEEEEEINVIYKKIIQEINEIKENNNNNNINEDKRKYSYGTIEDFKKRYEVNDLRFDYEQLNRIFIAKNGDYINTASQIIEDSYKKNSLFIK